MKSSEKPFLEARDNVIHLNGARNSIILCYALGSSVRKYDQVKSQIDVILVQDYSNWRVNKNKFNALNSLTAKSSEVIHSYVKGIYLDYEI